MTLELFPKHPHMDAYRVGGAYQPYAVVAVDKRFTDAELAAEYWRTGQDEAYIVEGVIWAGMCDDWSTSESDAMHRSYIIRRFATQPSYDE